MRGQGVGEALYAHVLKQAQKDQVRRVEWNVLDWNTPAIAFYEKSGARVLDDWRVAQMDDVAVTKFVNQYFSEP
jgi:ribosomal protein S18 acetylase RimI-like enzyme